MYRINEYLEQYNIHNLELDFGVTVDDDKDHSYENETQLREIRRINPPKLDDANIHRTVHCFRPVRLGSPKLCVETRGKQVIGHNYGHGGSGWTFGPGCALYVNALLEEKVPDRRTRITVIGAGVSGLLTAYDLLQRGYGQVEIVADRFDDLTSHRAGGLLCPTCMHNTPEAALFLSSTIALDSYRFYEAIARGAHAHFKEGATIMPLYTLHKSEVIEPYVTGGVMRPGKTVSLDFGNGTKRKMYAYDDAIFIHVYALMDQLTAYLKNRQVPFSVRKLDSFDELAGANVIVNCTGMGSASLNSDPELISSQGHLVHLKGQTPADMKYMIATDSGNAVLTPSGQRIYRPFYMLPKVEPGHGGNVGVLGATTIFGEPNATPSNEMEFDIILQKARVFYGTETLK